MSAGMEPAADALVVGIIGCGTISEAYLVGGQSLGAPAGQGGGRSRSSGGAAARGRFRGRGG